MRNLGGKPIHVWTVALRCREKFQKFITWLKLEQKTVVFPVYCRGSNGLLKRCIKCPADIVCT